MKEQDVMQASMIMIDHKQVVVDTIITITITITINMIIMITMIITMIIMITSRWWWKLFHCDLLTTRGIDLPSWSQETRSR